MPSITTKDGTEIFYKDWGAGQPIVFHHGWPLSADDWDAQMLFFLQHGYRVIAHDRRGHGRSTQTGKGNDMDTYAADVAALTAHLDLRNAVHVGHSTGGGEVARYVARYGTGPRRQGGADRRGAADHGQDREQSRRPADRGVRRSSRGPRREPGAVLPRRALGPLLRLQPARREGLRGRDRQLVAAGHDGRRQGPLRLHQGILGDRLHRGSQGDRTADPRHARRRRSDRPDRRTPAACPPSCCGTPS